jgi:hypothetical protein
MAATLFGLQPAGEEKQKVMILVGRPKSTTKMTNTLPYLTKRPLSSHKSTRKPMIVLNFIFTFRTPCLTQIAHWAKQKNSLCKRLAENKKRYQFLLHWLEKKIDTVAFT